MISATTPSAGECIAGEPIPIDLGHPVRNFVAVLLVAAAALGAIWWTGLLAPRLETSGISYSEDTCTREDSASFLLSNLTPLGITRTVPATNDPDPTSAPGSQTTGSCPGG